jgi:hypothetical protein
MSFEAMAADPRDPGLELAELIEERRKPLLEAGYGPTIAGQLAERFDIPVSDAVKLIKHGCSGSLAWEILA